MSVDMAVKVLDESLGKVVLIRLKGGKVIRGSLHGFDQHMNLLLEDSVEILEESKSNDLGTIVVTRRQCCHNISASSIGKNVR